MAASNLYPPIIDTFMPAFTTSQCLLYFELSDFNTLDDIETNLVQVSITNQKSNENSLKKLNGIGFYTVYSNADKYFVVIDSEDLKEGFIKGQYYKVQIRFTSKGTSYNGSISANNAPTASWINNNLENFSEWSSVCLIKRISEPSIFSNVFRFFNNQYKYDSRFLKYNATVEFNPDEKEYLLNYKLELIKDSVKIDESPILYPQAGKNLNKILYNFKKKLDLNTTYNLYLSYETSSGYMGEYLTSFVSPSEVSSIIAPIVSAIPDPDQGRIKIQLEAPNGFPNFGTYYVNIYRSSSKSNFQDWEEIALVNYSQINNSSTTYFDYSVESGVWYDYSAQVFNNQGACSPEGFTPDKVIVLYEDMFLNSIGRQLKLRFDSHITSYKKVVTENKIETLGSTYPIIRRNSATNYRQFSITGLISYFSDDGEIFLTEDNIYLAEDKKDEGGSSITDKYYEFNSENGITPYTDYIKEREFREKVINFLCSDKVFLLRTITEGLTLVRLMDINFTPKQELNNYIYTFTATAVEIAECNPENYYKYKVFPELYSTIQL